MNRTILSTALTALTLVSLGTVSHAGEIYSTFGPGNSYDSGISYSLGDDYQQSVMTSFVPTQNFTLTGFQIATAHYQGTNSYLFSVVADNGGLPTGSAIVSPFSSAVTNGISSFAATGSLLANQKYWLVVDPGPSGGWGGWFMNNIGITGDTAFKATNFNGGNLSLINGSTPAFRINGDPVNSVALTPELPAGVQAVPVLLAVAGMALYQRKKKQTAQS